jgi:hypothetical protein
LACQCSHIEIGDLDAAEAMPPADGNALIEAAAAAKFDTRLIKEAAIPAWNG